MWIWTSLAYLVVYGGYQKLEVRIPVFAFCTPLESDADIPDEEIVFLFNK